MPEDRPERLPYPFPLPADLLDDPDDDAGRDSLSAFAVANHLLRHLRWILVLPLLAFGVTFLYMTSQDRPYVAESRFLPAKGDPGGGGGGSGVISQLNRLVGGANGGSDGVFYSFLASSSAFLRPAARTEFEFTRRGESGEPETVRGTLAEIHGHDPVDEQANTRLSLGILKSMVKSRAEPGTGFVSISVQAPWPELAVVVNNRLVELVNEFNVEQRQTRAAAEREFVEARMATAKEEREEAERELVGFLQTNQNYEQAPRLRYEAMRLESQVQLKRNLYSSLAQSFEQARITEVRNTPVITVVEHPEETVTRAARGSAPLRTGAMAAIIIALLTIGMIAARAYFTRERDAHPDDFEEFRRLARAAVPDRLRARLAAWNGRSNGGPKVTAGSASEGISSDTW